MALFFGKTLTTAVRGERQEGARFALFILSGIHLLYFVDRYIPGAVKIPIKEELNLTDMQTAIPTTAMVIVYMIFCVVFGYVSDMQIVDRRVVLAFGIFLWSVATVLGGLAQNFWQLVLFRALVGVGEAAYGIIAPPMIADFFPPKDRIMAFTVFMVMAPVGGAIGFALGSFFASVASWRVAFYICGAPGLALASMALMINNPVREESEAEGQAECESNWKTLRGICTNMHWWAATLGCAALSFTIGGFADWISTFLQEYKGASLSQAGLAVGIVTVLGGIGGNLLGNRVVTAMEYRVKSAYFIVPGLFQFPAVVTAALLMNCSTGIVSFVLLLLTEICMFTYIVPLTTATLNTLPAHRRSRALALQATLIHLIGDLISPPIIGAISDATGSLKTAMQITWIAPAIAGILWVAAYLFLEAIPVLAGEGKGGDTESLVVAKEEANSYGTYENSDKTG